MIPNPPQTPLNPQTGGQGGRRAGGNSRDEKGPQELARGNLGGPGARGRGDINRKQVRGDTGDRAAGDVARWSCLGERAQGDMG